MSNLTRLEAVSASLDTAISTANSLPDAGSGGGTSVETCTFTFEGNGLSNYYPRYISYMAVDNGVIKTVSEDLGTTTSEVTVTCLCDSIVVVQTISSCSLAPLEDVSMLYNVSNLVVFHIEAAAGGTVTIQNGGQTSGGV